MHNVIRHKIKLNPTNSIYFILVALIAAKKKEDYSQVMCYSNTRLSMDVVRSVPVAVRAVGGKAKKTWVAPISNVSFKLIPEEKSQKY